MLTSHLPSVGPLQNRAAIVTGASRGIGFAIAQTFFNAGATVYMVARNKERLHEAARRINDSRSHSAHPAPRAIPLVGDVSLRQTWTGLVDGPCVRNPPSVLVNAAGIAQASLLTKTSDEKTGEILNVNLWSTILGCKVVGRVLMKRPSLERSTGMLSIINVSSVMATHGQAGASVYAASKAGILGLTTALSREYGHFGVRVNAILPGYIDTEMLQDQNAQTLASKIPLRRLGDAKEVADAAAFLACNPYANNCHLTIDGGLSGNF